MALPKSESEFEEYIRSFEAGAIPKEQWHHAEHVAMAFWYLVHFDEDVAIEKIRLGIQNLVRVYGVKQTPTGGYHETWTIFFAKILHRHMAQEPDRGLSLIERMNVAIRFLAEFRAITLQYYSRELIDSWEARTSWKEPDLKPL